MKYELDTLSEAQFKELKRLINNSLNSEKNPKLGRMGDYSATSTYFKTKNNLELINFVNSITGYKKENINSFFHIVYEEGDRLPRHQDRSNPDIKKNPSQSISYSFLLEMSDGGGEFMLNDTDIQFNIPGSFVSFNGYELFHEIKKVTKGKRASLIVWYRREAETKLF